MTKTLLTSQQAAELLQVDPSRIRQLRLAGVLTTVERYGRKLVKRSQVEKYDRTRKRRRRK